MMTKMKTVGTIALLSVATITAQTQTTSAKETQALVAHHKQLKTVPGPTIEAQLREMRVELQSEIDDLKTSLAAKDVQIAALQAKMQTVQEGAGTIAVQVHSIDNNVQENVAAVTNLQTAVSTTQRVTSTQALEIATVRKGEESVRKDVEEPRTIRYRGIEITPGGFVAGESIWRQRAMNADIYTNFNATPYMNTGEAHTSEWVPSARQSRLSTLASGKVPFGTISGYYEGDFLSAGITSNNLQSNSYTLRVRQAWAQASFGHMKFTAGQMWTLLMENKVSADPGQEAVPLSFDGNLHVGSTYIRQLGYRFEDQFKPTVTFAFSLENSQYQFSASNAPSNFFFGAPGAVGGLNNSSANYTNQVAPDLITKVAFDPKLGHFEVGGVGRFFRDRYYPNATSVGAQNDTRFGGGFVANARFKVNPEMVFGVHLAAGDGIGRYGPALLPDVTVRPDGTLSPLRNAQGLVGIEIHPTTRLDIFGYAGTEYVQRTYYRSASGTLVGYAPPSGSNVGCFVEPLPTAGTGVAPGTGTCLGATRDITEGTVGYAYRVYSGPAGKLQYGISYSYLNRVAWTGVGGAPKATNNFVYTSFRYYIP
jgi:hypothetical protein